MKSKMKKIVKGYFLPLYIMFTIACGELGWMFPEQEIVIFRIWYQVFLLKGLWAGFSERWFICAMMHGLLLQALMFDTSERVIVIVTNNPFRRLIIDIL